MVIVFVVFAIFGWSIGCAFAGYLVGYTLGAQHARKQAAETMGSFSATSTPSHFVAQSRVYKTKDGK